ncbi:MAG: radical SAM family heme chaperone HemW [Nitrosomonas sp.]|nr:radical SAM family heme chaperone HemW [Nitrosomonas sp.]
MTIHLPVRALHAPILTELPPLSLYIHLPWCIKKCPYCDFNSHAVDMQAGLPEEAYLAALKQDIEMALPTIWGRPVISVFFGGGTPSLFSAKTIDAILSYARMLLPLTSSAEITLEANPGTFEIQKFADFRAAGINRLSIGIQSFNRRHLQLLGRVHDDLQAHRAVEIACHYFDNVNLDLMYALPEQTLAEARQDIEQARACNVSHLSVYHLTLEPNTWFHQHPPRLPDDDQSADMQEMVERLLAEQGYDNYEISAFAKPGKICRHNFNYWQYGDYLGVGAGAHSKISSREKIVRQMRHKHPRRYLEQAENDRHDAMTFIAQEHEVLSRDRAFEFMMNALRLPGGFDPALFQSHTGLALSTIQKQLDVAEQQNLIIRAHDRIQPTCHGRRYLNDLLGIFLPDNKH